jgi:WD40 repeat protein
LKSSSVDTEGRVRQAASKLARALLQDESLAVVRALGTALSRLEDDPIRQGIAVALGLVHDQPGIDVLWSVWRERRDDLLEGLLRATRCPASSPPALRVLSALCLDDLEAVASAGGEVVEPLLAAVQDSQPAIQQRARTWLRSLKTAAAQEALCRWAIEHAQPDAQAACLEAGYAPRDPLRRALFYLLTEQWERYVQLDFDARLLRVIYETGNAALRARIAGFARRSGWVGFVEAAAGRRTARRLAELTETEWEVIQTLLSTHQRWNELWELAQAAPPVWSARILRDLNEMGWAPAGESEAHGFLRLNQAASSSLEAGIPPECLAHFQASLEGHRRPVSAAAISPDGQVLVSASLDKTVRLWQLPDGELVKVLDHHTSYVLSLAVSSGGEWLATGSGDRTARVWRLPAGEPHGILGGHVGAVAALAFSPDGQWLASGDQRVGRVWRLADGKLVHVLDGYVGAINTLAFPSEENTLVGGDEAGTLCTWSLPSGELTATLMENVSSWAVGPGGSSLFSCRLYGPARLWQLPEGQLLKTFQGRVDGRLLAISPEGDNLAASDREAIRLWRLPQEAEYQLFEGHPRPVTALAFHPAGRLLVSGSEDGSLCFWQTDLTGPVSVLEGLSGAVKQVLFSPDGSLLAGVANNSMQLWRLEDLGRSFRTPVEGLSLEWAARAEAFLRSGKASTPAVAWLEFALGLVRWQRRFDIEVEEPVRRIAIGEYDIEIA